MMNNDSMKQWAYEKFTMFQNESNMDSEFAEAANGPIHNKNFGFISKNKPTRSNSGYSQLIFFIDVIRG